jgi:hypothetical protein
MDEKIALIKNNDTWRLVPKLSGKNPIGFKWIYSQKNAKGEVKRYKAILVAKAIVKSMRLIIMKYLL